MHLLTPAAYITTISILTALYSWRFATPTTNSCILMPDAMVAYQMEAFSINARSQTHSRVEHYICRSREYCREPNYTLARKVNNTDCVISDLAQHVQPEGTLCGLRSDSSSNISENAKNVRERFEKYSMTVEGAVS